MIQLQREVSAVLGQRRDVGQCSVELLGAGQCLGDTTACVRIVLLKTWQELRRANKKGCTKEKNRSIHCSSPS